MGWTGMVKFFRFMERWVYPILFFAVVAAISAGVQAEESVHTATVNAMGKGTIKDGNTVAAREEAISDGLVSALEQVVADVLPLDPLVQNFYKVNEILYGKTGNFILEYKVLAETRYKNFYRVMLQASVSIDNVKRWLYDTGVIPGKKKMVKILFLTTEQNSEDVAPDQQREEGMRLFKTAAERFMAETMKERGFSVLDPEAVLKTMADKKLFKADLDDKTAVNTGVDLGADVVIVGRSSAQEDSAAMGSDIKSFKGTVEVRALRTDTGETIASAVQTAVSVNPDEIVARRNALSDAGFLAGEALADKIAAALQVKEPARVKIVVQGTADLANFVTFRNAISNMPEVGDIQVMEMKSNEAVILVDFKGNAGEFADALMLNTFDSFGIGIVEVSGNDLRIELVSGESQNRFFFVD